MEKYFHWLFCDWSKWVITRRFELYDTQTADRHIIGSCAIQERTCKICNKLETNKINIRF